jgi:hypothetical protein
MMDKLEAVRRELRESKDKHKAFVQEVLYKAQDDYASSHTKNRTEKSEYRQEDDEKSLQVTCERLRKLLMIQERLADFWSKQCHDLLASWGR